MSDPRDDLAALPDEQEWNTLADLVWEAMPDEASYNEATGHIIARAILAAGWIKPKPPKVYPDHDIDVERAPYCTVCGRDVQWNDDTDQWEH
jgi:hypothetical protein